MKTWLRCFSWFSKKRFIKKLFTHLIFGSVWEVLRSKVWDKTSMSISHTIQIQVMHFKLFKVHVHTYWLQTILRTWHDLLDWSENLLQNFFQTKVVSYGSLFNPNLYESNFLISSSSLALRMYGFSLLTFSSTIPSMSLSVCPGRLKCSPLGSKHFSDFM